MSGAQEGDAIALVGWRAEPSLAASELAKLRGEPLPDGLPAIDLAAVIATQDAVREAVRRGTFSSAHDITEGGLAIAIAECCLAGGVGATVAVDATAESQPAALFGEAPGGFVVSGPQSALTALATSATVLIIGVVGGDSLRIDLGEAREPDLSLSVTLAELAAAHRSLEALFP